MTDGVGQRLGDDSVEGHLDCGRQALELVDLDVYIDLAICSGRAELSERSCEPELIERQWPKVM